MICERTPGYTWHDNFIQTQCTQLRAGLGEFYTCGKIRKMGSVYWIVVTSPWQCK